MSGRLRRTLWDSASVSFDVYFQRFRDGDTEPGGGEAMRDVLADYIVREEPEHAYARVEYGDGSADIYLSPDAMMANHVTGEEPWELLVRGAKAAGWVVMPVGCAPCITYESDRTHLPEGLGDEALLVTTGEDLVRVIRAS